MNRRRRDEKPYKLLVLLGAIILAVLAILPGCGREINSSQGGLTSNPAASPISKPQLFRSDSFYLSVQLPAGWAGVEGPESLARSKINGYVAFNSWGQEGFWARELSKDNIEAYDPQTIISQVPHDGAYLVLDEIVTLAAPPGNEPPEYTLNDLSGLTKPHDWRHDASSQAQSICFFKWGRLLQFYIACQSEASDSTVSALNNLLQSWKFDEILAGDPGWAFTIARQLLPAQVGPEKFPRKGGTTWDQTVARATQVEVRRDKTVHFRFNYYWNLPAASTPGPIGTPSETYHWWEIDVPASGQAVLSAQGGTPLPASSTPPPSTATSGVSGPARNLRDSEKATVIQIAVNSPEAQQRLKGRTDYRVRSVDWYAITFQDGKAGARGIVKPGSTGSGLLPSYLTQPLWIGFFTA
jgi:hypothetical protein